MVKIEGPSGSIEVGDDGEVKIKGPSGEINIPKDGEPEIKSIDPNSPDKEHD